MIRVLLVDDHAVVRAGLTQLLDTADDLEVVGAAEHGGEAVRMAGELRPDVVLMDLSMPEVDGIAATREIRAAGSDAQVVILTSFSDRDKVVQALDAGAIGYLLKDAEPDELLRGVRAAARGESPLAPKAASALLASRAEPSAPAGGAADDLTTREREILALLAEGHPNKVIARRLEIAEKTVKNHVSRIFQTLGVTDRTQAALWVQRHGLGG